MLIDVSFGKIDPALYITYGSQAHPERIGEGMYLMTHWPVDPRINVRERWCEDPPSYLDFDEVGVCDTPEQCVEKLGLRERPEKFFVTYVKLRRADQPSEGGWRWHKWGDYIGTRDPQCEYLHDEPEIEEVYAFRVYEPIDLDPRSRPSAVEK